MVKLTIIAILALAGYLVYGIVGMVEELEQNMNERNSIIESVR